MRKIFENFFSRKNENLRFIDENQAKENRKTCEIKAKSAFLAIKRHLFIFILHRFAGVFYTLYYIYARERENL